MRLRLFLILLLISLRSAAQFSESIGINTSLDVDSIREEIREYVFGNEIIPEFIKDPQAHKLVSKFSNIYSDGNIAKFETGTVNLKHGFTSKICLFSPAKSNSLNIPIIYHTGHGFGMLQEDLFVNYAIPDEVHIKVIDFFLSKGFDVIGIDMPFYGANKHPAFVTENGITMPMYGHNDFFNLEHPFYYFLAPIKSVIDYLQREKGYNQFVMLGLSGGGWTTTVYSAMDPRISLSFPVAGSIPVPLRTALRDLGDLEQYFPGFYDRFNYSTLYYMAASGQGRRQVQVLNKYDHCCFAFNGKDLWVDSIKKKLTVNGDPGSYDFFFDTIATNHRISAVAADTIYQNILAYLAEPRLKSLNAIASSRQDLHICDNDTLTLSVAENEANQIGWYYNDNLDDTLGYEYVAGKPGYYFASVENRSGAVIHTDTVRVDQSLVMSKPVLRWANGKIYSSYAGANRWYYNGDLIEGFNEAGGQYQNGRYTARAVAGNCISDMSDPFYVGINVVSHPSLSSVDVVVSSYYGTVQYAVINSMGVVLQRGMMNGFKSIRLPVGTPGGVYYLKLLGGTDLNTVKKFVIR
jgi:pimeloyl-ACP methyl ester carboxylesterase